MGKALGLLALIVATAFMCAAVYGFAKVAGWA